MADRSLLAAAAVSLALFAGAPLLADTVHKKDGRKVDGTIVDEGADAVTIKTKFGLVTIPRGDILSIEKGATPAQEFKLRWDETDKKDVLALLDLVDFCSENRLNAEKKKVLTAILQVDPENESAREGLGYVLQDGEWITKAELAKLDRERRAAERKERETKRGGKAEETGAAAAAAAIGDVSADIVPFMAEIPTHQAEDEKMATELFDFFGQRFSVVTSTHFTIRAQMPVEDNTRHVALAERMLVTCNKLFDLPADQPRWPGRYVWFHVKQKGTFIDLIDWIDKNFTELDAEIKKLAKDGGGFNTGNPTPISAKLEEGVPLDRSIANEVGNAWVGWFTRGAARPWLEEGFGAYTSIMEFGVNQIWHTTNTKYAGRTEVAEKNSDAHLRLVAVDIVDGSLDKPYAWLEITRKKLNDLDYADLAKSYSVVDFLMSEHRDKFREFLQKLPMFQDDEAALRAVFGWTSVELEDKWKEYVLANYSRAPAGD